VAEPCIDRNLIRVIGALRFYVGTFIPKLKLLMNNFVPYTIFFFVPI